MTTEYLALLSHERRQMYGEWLPEQPSLLASLALQYHTECDVYDIQVCTGRDKGEPVPATAQEQRLTNRHAYQVKQRLLAENPVSSEELHQIIATESRK
jgi:hypothetical protein